MTHSLSADLHDPDLFEDNAPGDYTYEGDDVEGKSASGQLAEAESPVRDPVAQRSAGGAQRRSSDHEWGADDGGHLIAARFGGSPYAENLTAQDRNLNRSGYKRMESEWATHLDNGDKVFVNVETGSGARPDAYMGYAIYEHPDGTRDYDTFSYVNESTSTQDEWEEEFEQFEAEGYSGDEVGDYRGSAAEGGTYPLSEEAETQSFASSSDEWQESLDEEIDDSMWM